MALFYKLHDNYMACHVSKCVYKTKKKNNVQVGMTINTEADRFVYCQRNLQKRGLWGKF